MPERLDAEEQKKLEALLDTEGADSAWSKTLSELGLRWPGGPMLRWVGGTPYVNGSQLTRMVSAGCIEVRKDTDRGYAYHSNTRLLALPALLKSQWKIETYLAEALAPGRELPGNPAAQIHESLKLGIVLQALMMRLPKHDARELAAWLAGSVRPPAQAQKTVEALSQVQRLRTRLSPAWNAMFQGSTEPRQHDAKPWFWDDEPGQAGKLADGQAVTGSGNSDEIGRTVWKGLPVHPGRVSGAAWLAPPQGASKPSPPYVAVFAHARPQAVEFYEGAAAVVFCEGGLLSHACVVAREQGLPAVTGAGSSLLRAIQRVESAWLTVDGSSGEVALSESPYRSGSDGSKSGSPSG